MRALVPCVLVVCVGLHAGGCGDGGAGAPTAPASSELAPARIVSGSDGRPVAGAEVRVEGVGSTEANGNGEVMAGPAVGVPPGAEIDVEAPGFLPRRTRVPADRLVTLWPVAGDAEAEAVRQMVYGGPRGEVLQPTVSTQFAVILDPASSGTAAQAWTSGAAEFGAPFGFEYEVTRDLPSDGDWLNPIYDWYNRISVRFAGSGGCDTLAAWGFCLEFPSREEMLVTVQPSRASEPQTIRRVLASWFLGPNPLPGLMNLDAPSGQLSPLEDQTIRMILQRPLPNRWPDSDR